MVGRKKKEKYKERKKRKMQRMQRAWRNEIKTGKVDQKVKLDPAK